MIRTEQECIDLFEKCRSSKKRYAWERIWIYFWRYCGDIPSGTTRHEVCDKYFWLPDGNRHVAGDGGKPIPWQSISTPIKKLILDGYIIETTWEDKDPVTGEDSKRLYLATAKEEWWKSAPSPKMF